MINSRSSNSEQAGIAQSVVRRIGSAEVTGPIPVSSSNNPDEEPVNNVYRLFFRAITILILHYLCQGNAQVFEYILRSHESCKTFSVILFL